MSFVSPTGGSEAEVYEDANLYGDMVETAQSEFEPLTKLSQLRRISFRPNSFEEEARTSEVKVYPKSAESEVLLDRALQSHFLFSQLSDLNRRTTIDAMERVEKPRGIIINQGERGDHFYIIESGKFSVFIEHDGQKVFAKEFDTPGQSFGELALLHNAPRAATVAATTPCVLFRLARYDFRQALTAARQQDMGVLVEFLRDVPLFKGLDSLTRQRIATVLQPRRYVPGEKVIRQGEPGRCLYIVQRGWARCTKLRAGVDEVEVPRKRLTTGDIFGEGSLLTGHPRVGNVVVGIDPLTCLLMDATSFMDIVAPMLPDLQLNYVISILKSVPLFEELDDDNLYQIVGVMEERHFENKDYIYRQNDVADAFYIIMAGKVATTLMIAPEALKYHDPEEEEKVVAEMLVGEFLGEMALVESNAGQKRRMSAVAVGRVRCYVLARTAFLQLIGPVRRIEQLTNEREARRHLSKRFISKDFVNERPLGNGEHSRVRMAFSKGMRRSMALKSWRKHVVDQHKLLRSICAERDMIYRLKHPFIVEAYGSFADDHSLVLVYELLPGGSLYGLMKAEPQNGVLSNEMAVWFTANVILALEYLHSQNIAYLDLRPEALLIDKAGYLKLTNFTNATKLYSSTSLMFDIVGIPEYIPPEMLLGTGYTKAADLWQLGVLIYEMLVGSTPFNLQQKHKRDALSIFKEVFQPLQFPPGARNLHAMALDLIGRLLQQDPTKRLGAEDWAHVKAHKWFKPVDWVALGKKAVSMPHRPRLGATNIDLACFITWDEKAPIIDAP
eukprot:CAMPEP_0114543934 /NCGR_PEP_ID=MMETSP0114-20121206/2615_1 /TAXON_ID=31324 /ORGANISM="Goniomonas sp, Strain m" /LENGTH=783 /DNA_ID=CAMNT_0001728295 /DNA_START=249 /DNA_END=2596 /DNA_ORIENTATION=-